LAPDPELSMNVENLFVKARRGEAMREVDSLSCLSGLGIDGDIHANRLSPRQILITLQSELDAFSLAPGALFENMVIARAAPGDVRPGAALVTERDVEIRLTMYCEPCKRILPVVGDLRRMLHRRGMLGYIVGGGEIRAGDAISIVPGKYAALPDSPVQKFRDFIPTIPAGKVVRYTDVAIAMGVDQSFVRALPGYIRRNGDLPVHRIVNARGRLLDFVPGQTEALNLEGVHADASGAVDFQSFLWKG
jgi:alkylated DNA nucleotide flippase Atl1